jgi:hypothetical protein
MFTIPIAGARGNLRVVHWGLLLVLAICQMENAGVCVYLIEYTSIHNYAKLEKFHD